MKMYFIFRWHEEYISKVIQASKHSQLQGVQRKKNHKLIFNKIRNLKELILWLVTNILKDLQPNNILTFQ